MNGSHAYGARFDRENRQTGVRLSEEFVISLIAAAHNELTLTKCRGQKMPVVHTTEIKLYVVATVRTRATGMSVASLSGCSEEQLDRSVTWIKGESRQESDRQRTPSSPMTGGRKTSKDESPSPNTPRRSLSDLLKVPASDPARKAPPAKVSFAKPRR